MYVEHIRRWVGEIANSEMAATWEKLTNDVPSFVINMDRCKERWRVTKERIVKAGFRNVQRVRGVDAENDSLKEAWAVHGSPRFNPTDTEFVEYPGKQGCMLSHLNVWKKMIDENIPVAIIFEDDVSFHSRWDVLAPKYFQVTPKDWDILYMGSQIDHLLDAHIQTTPVFCTHAYVITYAGAKTLYTTLLGDAEGVRTIDCMIIDIMKDYAIRSARAAQTGAPAPPAPFTWYVWNGLKFPDAQALSDPHWAKRNTGLVFQDVSLGTFVRPWH